MGKRRLSKALSAGGIASRRNCEELIFKGKVSVNGIIVRDPQVEVDCLRDVVMAAGKKVTLEHKAYYLLHKPRGFLCSTMRKQRCSKLIVDLFPPCAVRLFTIGRLDKDTSGLLILTNDGELANRIAHPSFKVHKEYLVKTKQEITAAHLKSIAAGVRVQNTFIKPLSVKKVRKGTLKIVVGEGKKHEIRHLIAAAELHLITLKRIRIGSLTLGNLPEGFWRELTHKEISSFLSN